MASDIAKGEDLRMRTDEELTNFVRDKQDELMKLNFQRSIGQLENVRRVAQVKREIARAHTVISQRAKKTA